MEQIEPTKPTLKTAGDAPPGGSPKRRRVDWHLDQATVALAGGRRSDALAAIAAIARLDPNSPQLAVLQARLESLPRPGSRPYSRRWLGGAAIVVCGLLSGYSMHKPPYKQSHVLTAAVDPAVPVMEGEVALLTWSARGVEAPLRQPRPTSGPPDSRAAHLIAGPRTAAESPPPPSGVRREEVSHARPAREVRRASVLPHEPSGITGQVPSVNVTVPTDTAALARRFATPTPGITAAHTSDALDIVSVTASAAEGTSAVPSPNNDERLVNQVLQRYREAYAELDARSAREIWPRVDEAALARAFDDLRSQQITFDVCNL